MNLDTYAVVQARRQGMEWVKNNQAQGTIVNQLRSLSRNTREFISSHWRGAVVAGVGAASVSACVEAPPAPTSIDRDAAVICEPTGSQEYQFGANQGINDAVLTIQGSGAGVGDPCWSEAVTAVRAAVGNPSPNAGDTVTIPAAMEPLTPTPTT